MNAGSYCVVRQKKSSARQGAGDFKFDPSWVVRFSLPGQKVRVESSRLHVCDLCLAVPPDQNPVRVRENCRCLKPVRAWADVRLKVLARLWQENRIGEMQAMLRPRDAVTIGKLIDTYLAQAPDGMAATFRDNVNDLTAILTQATGQSREKTRELPVTVLTQSLAVDWMTLRYHYNQDRRLPEENRRSWDDLRAQLKAGKLSAPPRNVAADGNYTIRSMMTKVRSIIGDTARTHYLRGLELPQLTFVNAKGLLAARAKHTALSPEIFAEIEKAAAEALKKGDEEFFIAHMLASRFGCRPIEILASRRSWLMWDGAKWILDVRNRADEGFLQKPRARAVTGQYAVPDDLARVLLTRSDLFFLPAGSPTARENLLRRTYSEKLRTWIPKEEKDTWYSLRKLYLSVVYQRDGKEAAKTAARHASSDVVEAHYAQPLGLVPSVNANDLLRNKAASI